VFVIYEAGVGTRHERGTTKDGHLIAGSHEDQLRREKNSPVGKGRGEKSRGSVTTGGERYKQKGGARVTKSRLPELNRAKGIGYGQIKAVSGKQGG